DAFPSADPKSSLNPVNYSHVTIRLAGKRLNVISRVGDAGQDYSGRTNKLAHHIVVDSVSMIPAGPVRVLMEPGNVVERWDGQVRNIAPRVLKKSAIPSLIRLSAWKALTGDGGWAGWVAEQLLQNTSPVCIIFSPGTDTRTLLREVFDLIPVSQRWNVTFSTYFTRLLAGTDCQLRFVLDDTPEATTLRHDARARTLDLTQQLPAATGGVLVTQSRQGEIASRPSSSADAATANPAAASLQQAVSTAKSSVVDEESDDEVYQMMNEPGQQPERARKGRASEPRQPAPNIQIPSIQRDR
ncbi:MAG: hypothetical protein ACK50J_06515, partial [Planctomyces sp.]